MIFQKYRKLTNELFLWQHSKICAGEICVASVCNGLWYPHFCDYYFEKGPCKGEHEGFIHRGIAIAAAKRGARDMHRNNPCEDTTPRQYEYYRGSMIAVHSKIEGCWEAIFCTHYGGDVWLKDRYPSAEAAISSAKVRIDQQIEALIKAGDWEQLHDLWELGVVDIPR